VKLFQYLRTVSSQVLSIPFYTINTVRHLKHESLRIGIPLCISIEKCLSERPYGNAMWHTHAISPSSSDKFLSTAGSSFLETFSPFTMLLHHSESFSLARRRASAGLFFLDNVRETEKGRRRRAGLEDLVQQIDRAQ
jgi:hypothetical protein